VGCKSRLLFAKIAMAIWFQVSGVRCQGKSSLGERFISYAIHCRFLS
jgi:hypothetical protein